MWFEGGERKKNEGNEIRNPSKSLDLTKENYWHLIIAHYALKIVL